jgi:DNA uptake protein ComE-like DNA-binding protein
MPGLDRSEWGWGGPSMGLLTVLTVALTGGLAWSSKDNQAGTVALPSLLVDANSAPIPVLGALPGLGPVLAGRIVAAREVKPFGSIDDFDRRVYGIGPAKVSALRPFLRFGPSPVSHP